MATIIFVLRFQRGHLNPVLTLARAVRDRGHRVIVVSLLDVEEHVRGYDLEFRAFAPDLLPKGLTEPRQTTVSRLLQPVVGLGRLRTVEAQVYARLRRGELSRLLHDVQPDLFLVDSLLTIPALAALATGVRTALVSTMLPIGFDPGVPPSTSTHVPDGSARSAVAIRAAWAWRWCVPQLRRLAAALAGAAHPGGLTFGRHLKDYAASIGASSYVERGCFGWHLALPELIFGPEELDLPGRRRPHLRYIEAGVDLARPQAAFAWPQAMAGRRLVYCSLGTLDFLFPLSLRQRFYRAVLDAIAARPDLYAIVVTGSTHPASFDPVPANVQLLPSAPQLTILEQASLAITHGGTASVRECLYFGVPMIVFPVAADTFGNAARVAYHHLGLLGQFRRVTASRLMTMMSTILEDEGYARRTREMQRLVQARERSGIGVSSIEALLTEAPSLSLADRRAPDTGPRLVKAVRSDVFAQGDERIDP